jgi:hypothetical protein
MKELKTIKVDHETWKTLRRLSVEQEKSIGNLIKENFIKEEKMKLTYDKNDFFDKDGWIRFDGFSVAVGEGGEVEYCNPLKNKSYYEQNPYYQVIQIMANENDIQDDISLFEKKILEKLEEVKEMKITDVIENIKKIKNVEESEIRNEIICAFEDYNFEGETEVIVSSNNQVYINHINSPIIEFATENNNDKITVTNAWIV